MWQIARRLFSLHDEYGGRELELERDAERRQERPARERARDPAHRLDPDHGAHGATSSCEPFAHWAEEVSRYSFETGQQVFARAREKPG